jgi:hypothetical protein
VPRSGPANPPRSGRSAANGQRSLLSTDTGTLDSPGRPARRCRIGTNAASSSPGDRITAVTAEQASAPGSRACSSPAADTLTVVRAAPPDEFPAFRAKEGRWRKARDARGAVEEERRHIGSGLERLLRGDSETDGFVSPGESGGQPRPAGRSRTSPSGATRVRSRGPTRPREVAPWPRRASAVCLPMVRAVG